MLEFMVGLHGRYIYRDGKFFDVVIYIDTDVIYGYSGIVYDISSVDMTSLGGGV